MQLSSKIKGIFRVSAANLVALSLSMLTSFVLPLYISVEQYGYWQLFVLYTGYVGLFVLGFNDGIQLNYATFDYDTALASKFRSFKLFLLIMTGIETFLLIAASFFVYSWKTFDWFLAVLVIANIIPTAINGLFTYMNQSTMRFKQYSYGNLIDKVSFAGIMLVLLFAGEKNSLAYMLAFTCTRYLVIVYHFFSSHEVFVSKRVPLPNLKGEIAYNFRQGFPLMLAVILGGPSIIVGSRFLVQAKFGIEAFSAYSFSLHTLIIASQFISAVATVFYPILKRCKPDELQSMYGSFDKVATIFSAILLLSYYPAAFLVKYFYGQYDVILEYLFVVYPLFIFQCKSNVLITNMFKVKDRPRELILVNAFGIALHVISVFVAYWIFGGILAIASASLLAYAAWYYMMQIFIYKRIKWKLRSFLFEDFVLTIIFIIINIICSKFFPNEYMQMLSGFVACTCFLCVVWVIRRKQIMSDLRKFKVLMHD